MDVPAWYSDRSNDSFWIGGLEVGLTDKGQWVHTFHQSMLSELDLCPERGRATLMREMPKVETDAACLGTAVHAGIEQALKSPDALTPDEIEFCAQSEFVQLSRLPNFEWKKYSMEKALKLISDCTNLFYDEVYHTIGPVLVERKFGPLVIYEDDKRIIQIKGTIDLFDAYRGAVDFKTDGHGRKYRRAFGGDAWQLDRWAIQPTVYCEALRQLGYYDNQGPWPFTYLAFELGKQVELFTPTVYRRPEDIEWLRDKTVTYAKLVEADVKPWPKHDNHALCSPRWCPWWDSCKGAHYQEVDWPLRGT